MLWIVLSLLAFGLVFVIQVIFEVRDSVLMAILVLPQIILFILGYYFEVVSKPLVSTRVKVVKTWARKGYHFECILPDKKTKRLNISKKQWSILKNKEHNGKYIEVVYQGYIAHSIKICPDGNIIFYDKSSQSEIEKNSDKILTYQQTTKG